MSKRVYHYRIRRMAVGVYRVEEMHRFLFFKKYWIVGSRRLQLEDRYVTSEKAYKAIKSAAALKGIEVQITDLEAEYIRINRLVKGQVRQARKEARRMDEMKRNLRRIGKDELSKQ